MILTDKLTDLVNYRIHQEEMSSRIYKCMSLYLEFTGYTGAAKLWLKYSEEESQHAEWSYDYLLDLDILPELPALEKPKCGFKGLADIINISLEHEEEITNQCNTLATEAIKSGDHMLLHFAQHYLDEQREEIAKMTKWKDKIESFGTSKEALRLLDIEMGDF